MKSMSIKNLGDVKSAQCFECVTPVISFLTELLLETKSESFMMIINDLVNGLIVMSPQTLPKTKVSLAKDYGDSFVVFLNDNSFHPKEEVKSTFKDFDASQPISFNH